MPSYEINQEMIGREEVILVEGFSKKSDKFFAGRADSNKMVIVPVQDGIKEGDYLKAKITRGTSGTLFGDFIEKVDSFDNDIALRA